MPSACLSSTVHHLRVRIFNGVARVVDDAPIAAAVDLVDVAHDLARRVREWPRGRITVVEFVIPEEWPLEGVFVSMISK
jgi:hypothetical protein